MVVGWWILEMRQKCSFRFLLIKLSRTFIFVSAKMYCFSSKLKIVQNFHENVFHFNSRGAIMSLQLWYWFPRVFNYALIWLGFYLSSIKLCSIGNRAGGGGGDCGTLLEKIPSAIVLPTPFAVAGFTSSSSSNSRISEIERTGNRTRVRRGVTSPAFPLQCGGSVRKIAPLVSGFYRLTSKCENIIGI